MLGEYPATELLSTVNPQLLLHLFLASLAELDSTANPQLTQILTNQLLHYTSLHSTEFPQPVSGPRYIASGQTQQKTPSSRVCSFPRERFPSRCSETGYITQFVLLLRACMLRALPSNSCCLQSRRLATGLYATIVFAQYISSSLNQWIYDD
jgi:hypothetical protein